MNQVAVLCFECEKAIENRINLFFRSLVALSLILALLLLKPAPIYILDEVDAALDLSHTQNIGRMLKDHFKHSQVNILAILV